MNDRMPYALRAPLTPGGPWQVQYFHTLRAARKASERYQERKDLTYQDVIISLAGRHLEYAGPAR